MLFHLLLLFSEVILPFFSHYKHKLTVVTHNKTWWIPTLYLSNQKESSEKMRIHLFIKKNLIKRNRKSSCSRTAANAVKSTVTPNTAIPFLYFLCPILLLVA